MPEQVQVNVGDDPGASFAGDDQNVVDESILDGMPEDGTFGDTPDETPQEGGEPEAKPDETPEGQKPEGEESAKKEPEGEAVDWKARYEKAEREKAGFQSRYDQTMRQIQPYASKLAEMIRADQEKAQKMQGDRDMLLREFANDPAGVINTLMNAQLQTIRTQEQANQIQAEAQNAYHELVEYAAGRKVDENNLAVLLAPYGNFANMHPQQALALAKVVVDKAAAPQVNQQTAQEILKATDAQNKQKLVKKTPTGHAGGSVQGREQSEADKSWARIKNSGPSNPLRALR